MRDLQNIVHELKAKGAALKATEQPIDTSNAAGKCFLDMLGVFAEFETNLRRERQLEGIAKAKADGRYAGKGRPRKIDREEIMRRRLAKGRRQSRAAARGWRNRKNPDYTLSASGTSSALAEAFVAEELSLIESPGAPILVRYPG